MPNLRGLLSWLADRRKKNLPVSVERRNTKRYRLREASDALSASIERLHEATRRCNGYKRDHDAPGTKEVIFQTFAEVCTYRVQEVAARLCHHPKRCREQDAPCNEEACPYMLGAA